MCFHTLRSHFWFDFQSLRGVSVTHDALDDSFCELRRCSVKVQLQIVQHAQGGALRFVRRPMRFLARSTTIISHLTTTAYFQCCAGRDTESRTSSPGAMPHSKCWEDWLWRHPSGSRIHTSTWSRHNQNLLHRSRDTSCLLAYRVRYLSSVENNFSILLSTVDFLRLYQKRRERISSSLVTPMMIIMYFLSHIMAPAGDYVHSKYLLLWAYPTIIKSHLFPKCPTSSLLHSTKSMQTNAIRQITDIMNSDEVVEPLHCEDEWQPSSAVIQYVPTTNLYQQPICADTQSVSSTNLYRHPISTDNQSVPQRSLTLCCDPIPADIQSVPTTNLCRHPISAETQSVPPLKLYRHPISADTQSLSRRSLRCDSISVPIVDHESMEDAVYSSDLGSVTISADDLMDNRMMYQRAYPVALEDNESMEDPFRSDQSGAAWTYTTTYETHHSPHDPPMFEDRLVRYQPDANRDANVQADHDPEEGYLLRIQRILKNRSLMKTLLRGTCKALLAFLVANGLYGDIIYYHSGTSQYQTTISAGNVDVDDSYSRGNLTRRLVPSAGSAWQQRRGPQPRAAGRPRDPSAAIPGTQPTGQPADRGVPPADPGVQISRTSDIPRTMNGMYFHTAGVDLKPPQCYKPTHAIWTGNDSNSQGVFVTKKTKDTVRMGNNRNGSNSNNGSVNGILKGADWNKFVEDMVKCGWEREDIVSGIAQFKLRFVWTNKDSRGNVTPEWKIVGVFASEQ